MFEPCTINLLTFEENSIQICQSCQFSTYHIISTHITILTFSANLTSRGLVRTSGTKVQAEEVGIVLVVLLLWAAAIALFINRWGKIRQMEPYHPYVEETEAPVSQQPPNPASIPQSNQVNNKNIMTWFCHIQHYSRLVLQL